VSTNAVTQLGRLLAMIPWLLARPGVGVEETAEEFGITPAQLRKDLELAFMCGLPGHLPDDLIDVSLEGDRIVVSNADTIARPLRLAADEALALLVGLQALAQLPQGHDSELLDTVTATLERAAGDAAEAHHRIHVQVETDDAALATLRPALATGNRLRLHYYVPARDEVTERDVDPLRLLVVGGRAYLEGYCHRAEQVRLFRLDRIEPASVQVLDLPAEIPDDVTRPDLSEGVFAPDPFHTLATLEVSASARWVADAYPVEAVTDRPDGGAMLRLRVGDPRWLVRLALRLGGAVRIVEPAAAASDAVAAAAAALTRYA